MGSASNTSSSISDSTAKAFSASMASALSSARSSSGHSSPGAHQLQATADDQRKLHATQTSLATQHRLACDVHLQPRFSLVVPRSFKANRQNTSPARQNVSQTWQFIQSDATIQHTAIARKFQTIKHCSGNRFRHSLTLKRQKRRMISCPTPHFQVRNMARPPRSCLHLDLPPRTSGAPADPLRDRRAGDRRVGPDRRIPRCHRPTPGRSQGPRRRATLPRRPDHRLRPGGRQR